MRMTPLMAGLATLGIIPARQKEDDYDEVPQEGTVCVNTMNAGNGIMRSFIYHADKHSQAEPADLSSVNRHKQS